MSNEQKIYVPDLGGLSGVEVIEVLVNVGDEIAVDTSLITLESDKASMEIPSTIAGIVNSIELKVGDKVSEGSVILTLSTTQQVQPLAPVIPAAESIIKTTAAAVVEDKTSSSSDAIYAGPSVRRLARVLGISLEEIPGSGLKNRITREDVELYLKNRISNQTSSASIPASPQIDFSQFGEINTQPLNKIKRLTGINLSRSWTTIPHVTQFDSADITDLEAFRKAEQGHGLCTDVKLTILAFVCKVVAHALNVFPQFNSSLDSAGENLIYKKYCNIGIAVETPNGLVVPVIQDVPNLSVLQIAKEMARLSVKAREKGLMPADMRGGCFTISSLGGIGGQAFTPIVNHPEVAILGLSRATIQPIYQGGVFVPRLMLPLSLSYDHRVIDGAEGARFTSFLCAQLSDLRRILL